MAMKNSGDSSPYVNNGPRVHEYLKEMNEKVISRFDWMTVGEGAGAGVEDAKRYAGTNENELDMIFTLSMSISDRHSMANGVTAVLIWWSSKRYFRSGRTDLKVWHGTAFTGITTISQEPCQDLEMTAMSTVRSLQKCLQPVCIL